MTVADTLAPPTSWQFTLTCPRCGALVAQRARSAGADSEGWTFTQVRALGDCTECQATVFVDVAAWAEPQSDGKDRRPEHRYIEGDQAPGMPDEVRPPAWWAAKQTAAA